MLPGHVLGATGAGDVKLMAAVGSLLGPLVVVNAVLFTAVAGGVLAVVVALQRKRSGPTLAGTGRMIAAPGEVKQRDCSGGAGEPIRIRAGDRGRQHARGAVAVAVAQFGFRSSRRIARKHVRVRGHEDLMPRQTAGMESREAPMQRPRRGSGNERGAALLETAVTLPIILMICVGIFEFGRAYQTWQVLTNAAREGARVAGSAARPTSRSRPPCAPTWRPNDSGTPAPRRSRSTGRSPSARTPAPRSRFSIRSLSSCSTRPCGS